MAHIQYREWENDSLHGDGILSFRAPKEEEATVLYEKEITKWSIYQGKFRNDEISGTGKMVYNYGDVYNGDWSNGLPNGQGVMIYGNKIYGETKENHHNYDNSDLYYDGAWVDGRKAGLGRFVCVTDQLQYYGEWSYDYFHGNGYLSDSESVIYDGEWYRGWPRDSRYDDKWPEDSMQSLSEYEGQSLSWRMQIVKIKYKRHQNSEVSTIDGHTFDKHSSWTNSGR